MSIVKATGRKCWNCGQEGLPAVGSRWSCKECEVSWFPIAVSVVPLNSSVNWYGKNIPVMDFSDPLTPSCP